MTYGTGIQALAHVVEDLIVGDGQAVDFSCCVAIQHDTLGDSNLVVFLLALHDVDIAPCDVLITREQYSDTFIGT